MNICLLIVFFICLPTNIYANEITTNYTNIEYLENGSYYETSIDESKNLTRSASIKTGTKTTKYIDASGNAMGNLK